MNANDEYRLELGKRADKAGLILTLVGESYRLVPQDGDERSEPAFETADLAEVDKYLARIEQG